MFDQHRGFLEEWMDPDFGLLDKLLANRSLSRIECEDIKVKHSFYLRNARLLDYISQKGKYDSLISALRDSRQTHLVNYLIENGEHKSEYGGDWPLTEKELSILDTNQESLVDLVDCSDLLARLYSTQVINGRQRETISSEPTNHRRNEVLLNILRKRSIDDYRQVVQCLHESNQSHVAKILEESGVVVRVHADLGSGRAADDAEDDIIARFTDVLSGRSVDEASRILNKMTEIGLTVIAAKKGQSVVLYIYCRTESQLTDLFRMNLSGFLRNTIELLFSQLLIYSTTAKYAEVPVENLKDVIESALTRLYYRFQMKHLAVSLPTKEYTRGRFSFSDHLHVVRAVRDSAMRTRHDLISFRKGDIMITTADPENKNIGEGGWWKVEHLGNGAIGYIPRNRVVIDYSQEHLTVKEKATMANKDIAHFLRQSLKGHTQNYNVLITGSLSDLSLQDYLEHPSDVDILSWHNDIHISSEDSTIPRQFTGKFYKLETCNSPAGFAKIIAYESSGKWTYCGRHSHVADPNHGPAFTQVRLNHHHQLSSDLVIALRYSVWPSNAAEWKDRLRHNGWPSNEIVRKIVNDGCHLIIKPHPSHSVDENEWRFSFSLAESTLARTWNDVQRYIYRTLRRIKSDIVKITCGSEQTILKTYHLKTLLFWACEQRPSSFWEEERIETSVKELLCQMIEWLIEKECPNYFIPTCNLFDCKSIDPDREIELLTSYAEDLKLDLPQQMRYKNNFQFKFPKKVLLFWQMVFNCMNFVNPRNPAEVMSSLNSLALSPLLIEEIRWIYKAIFIHLDIYSAREEVNSSAVEEVKRCFLFAKNNDMERDYCPITIQPFENVYDFIANIAFVESVTDNKDENQERESVSNLLHAPGFFLDILTITEVLNHQFIRPSYFLRAAYEANFYYTVLNDYQSVKQICDEALDVFQKQRFNQALHLGAEWIDFCKDRLSVIITDKWIQLFDEAIVVTTGFLVLCDAVKTTIGKLQTPSATIIDQRELGCLMKHRDNFYIRIDPIDFLRYIRRQCSRLIDDESQTSIDSNDFLKVCLAVGYRMNKTTCVRNDYPEPGLAN